MKPNILNRMQKKKKVKQNEKNEGERRKEINTKMCTHVKQQYDDELKYC